MSLKFGTEVLELAPALELCHQARTWDTASLPRVLPWSGLTDGLTELLGAVGDTMSSLQICHLC